MNVFKATLKIERFGFAGRRGKFVGKGTSPSG
jgi:hypothetical protein